MVSNLIEELDFYEQKVKEVRTKLYSAANKRHQVLSKIKVLSQEKGNNWAAYWGDSVEVMKGIPDNSIHYTIFSPPFSSLFTYSASVRDMGNSTDGQFYDHFTYLVPEMYRVTIPGRLLSFHCSDIPAMKERDGYIGLKDFPGDLLRIFEGVGFIYHSKVQIRKNELIEATRTKALSLSHKQVIKDSCRCRNGLPDWIITMLKPGLNPEPVSRGRGFEMYKGTLPEPKGAKNDNPKLNKYSQKIWQRYAASIWEDIRQGNTLNVKLAREKNDERHICPLQLDAIARCLELWTNPGDIVASWFAGIGSEGYQALKMGRKAVCVELKKSYYDLMVKNLKSAEVSKGLGFERVHG
uniref:Putative methyltransferase n=1 Tax=viral metagenome TaxID=1070528 RepID=A0A6M3XJJ1_9ZZZZ